MASFEHSIDEGDPDYQRIYDEVEKEFEPKFRDTDEEVRVLVNRNTNEYEYMNANAYEFRYHNSEKEIKKRKKEVVKRFLAWQKLNPEETPSSSKIWTDDDYDKCDNNINIEDGVKEDPITLEPLMKGADVVMVRKTNSQGTEMTGKNSRRCYNRSTLQQHFDTQLRAKYKLTDPIDRTRMSKNFFLENGGFAKKYTRAAMEGGRRKKRQRITKMLDKLKRKRRTKRRKR